MTANSEDILRSWEQQPYDRPRVTQESLPTRVANRLCSTALLVLAFAGANWLVNWLGDGAAVQVVAWSTIILFVWLTCAGIARLVKGAAK